MIEPDLEEIDLSKPIIEVGIAFQGENKSPPVCIELEFFDAEEDTRPFTTELDW